MHVRHMTTDDLEMVAALVHAGGASAYAIWNREERADVTADGLAADMARLHSESFVAFAGDRVCIGYAYARIRRGALWLDRLLVDRDAHEDDCAATLLHAVVINYIGDAAISVAVDPGDRRLREFFEDQGFVISGEEARDGVLVLRRLIARA